MRGLQPQVQNAITPFVEKLAPTSVWPENKVELFLANVLIHKSLPSLDIQINLQCYYFGNL